MKRGFSLLEVALAISIGLAVLAVSAFSYKQHLQSTQITKAKLLLTSVRQGISMYRFRSGNYPALTVLQNNTDDQGRPFYDLGKVGSNNRPLIDPLFPDASGSPILQTGTATASWGGWIYNSTTGEIHPNLPAADFPGDPPDQW